MRLSEVTARLREAGLPDAEGEARILFRHVTALPAYRLIGCDPDCQNPRLTELTLRRSHREPLQYLLGETEFYRETYRVTEAVLVPRADTEMLVEYAIASLPENAVFADFCTGSGCIAISVLKNRPDCRAYAVDLSAAALEIAGENAERNGVSDRIQFLRADLLQEIPALPALSAVLCNPPYIRRDVIPTLSPEVLAEPISALDGGEDGLLFYRSLIPRSARLLGAGGFLLFEIGFDQKESVSAIARAAGLSSEVRRDLGGNFRMAILRPEQ